MYNVKGERKGGGGVLGMFCFLFKLKYVDNLDVLKLYFDCFLC